MNNFLKGKIKIDDFIKHHNENFINYCEVIIYPDGEIEYACPSHFNKLLHIYCDNNIDILNKCYIKYDLDELLELTKCISVWYNGYINPSKITRKQYWSLLKLKNNKCISKDLPILNKEGHHFI